MARNVGSSYPGGPKRSSEDASPSRLWSTEDLEARGRQKVIRSRRAKKKRALLLVGAVSALAAGAFGYFLGIEARVEPPSQDAAETSADQTMNQQINRLMLELWKMEDLERQGR